MEVETLNAMINELLKRVSKEKDRGLQTLPKVEKWISMAEEVELKASSLLDKSISECHSSSTISESTLHYSETVCMTLKEVKALTSEGVFKVLVERAPLSHVKKMLSLQPIVSREMLLEKAWKGLAENEYRTLGLYGTAGVGKTTLLIQIAKKFIEVGDVSRLVIFVVVKSEGVEGIQDTIREKLGLHWSLRSEWEKANEIYKSLSRKRFVLLLDGVQREKMDFKRIGVPLPSRANGCKIVFTTRSPEACKSSKWVDDELEVKCLSPEEAWVFFQEIVGETTLKSHPDIPQLARIVARKCGGLPIALNLIGKTMSRKRTVREWHHAIHVLVSSAAEFSGREVPLLKFAYDNLPGEDIKSCFLYCALFPKNRDIRKQDLVDCLIGEGIIADEENREIAETKGYEMIGDLVIMGFLMDNESGYGVKMHDMVLEMALWIASQASDSGRRNENIFLKCGEIIHELPMVNDWNMVRRMSVTSTQIVSISDSPPYSELTTLFLQENAKLKGISSEFFRWMTSLVVLNLSSNIRLAELPEEVSNLVSLRFLNLSRSGIRRLPLALKKLKKLIHLDLDYTWRLKDIDVIASLLSLQVLRLFDSAPVDLGLMEDIHLLKSLKELNLDVEEVTVLQQLQSNHRLASCIRRLRLRRITITEGGILSLNSGIRELNIYECDIPEITIDWRSTIQREAVHSGNIDKIPQFQNINKVTLHSCKGLRDMTWLLFAPSLEVLTLFDCPQIEEVISKEKAMPQLGHTSEHPFQNLTRLILYALPKLESIYWTPLPFPVLEYLCIRSCPNLKRLPFNSESAKGNQVRLKIDEEWIKGVKWEDEATKQRVSDLNTISGTDGTGGTGTGTGGSGMGGTGTDGTGTGSGPQKLDAQGRTGATEWDDGSDHDGVTKIYVGSGGAGVQYVKFDYVKGGTPKQGALHGGLGSRGSTREIVINHPGEYLVSVEGWYDSSNVILGIQFKTNQKTSDYIGYEFNGTGTKFTLQVQDKKIIGFHGFASDHLNSIEAYFVPLASTTTPAKKLEAKGGETRAVWDDSAHDNVKKVYVGQGQDGVGAVKFEYTNGSQVVIGVEHGKSTMLGFEEFELESDEYITSVEGTYDKIFGTDSAIVTMLTFKTNKNKTAGPFGLEGSTPFVFKEEGYKISGFHGRAGEVINAIGVYLAPLGTIPLTPAQLTKKLEASGGDGGTLWDAGAFDGVGKVSVGQAKDGIGVVKFVYDKGAQVVVGNEHGKTTMLGFEEFELDYPSEYITAVDGTYDHYHA